MKKAISIVGSRGLPAEHGGFETFVSQLAPYLVEKGWDVTVYCQKKGERKIEEVSFNGFKLVNIFAPTRSSFETVIFDFLSTYKVLKERKSLILVLGYNTAIFSVLYKIFKRKSFMNMDGFEWKRKKWGFLTKAWLRLNQCFGCWFSDYLIADHPVTYEYFKRKVKLEKIKYIPYGGNWVDSADENLLEEYSDEKNKYGIVIGRPEPENHILEIVRTFSQRKRGWRLFVLGDYKKSKYGRSVVDVASDEVVFLGPIYDEKTVDAWLYFSKIYIHGHSVGGTNPSLVRAFGAGCEILAHKNKFNEFVIEPFGMFFENEKELDKCLEKLQENLTIDREKMMESFKKKYLKEDILKSYNQLFEML